MTPRLNSIIKPLRWLTPLAVIVAITVLSLKDVLLTPGMIGHTWDWATPAFADQMWLQANSLLWTWSDGSGTGAYTPLNSPYFTFLTLPLGILGGEMYSKLLLVLLLWVAGACMYRLAKDGLAMNQTASIVAAILYMLSPIHYSRIIAGHLNNLLGYALLPILALLFAQMIRTTAAGNAPRLRQIAIAGLVLGFELSLRSVLFLALIIVGAVVAVGLSRQNFKRLMAASGAAFVIALLLNLLWMVPFTIGFLTSGSLGRGYAAGTQATIVTEFFDRYALWQATSRPIEQVLRLFSITGVRIEYINPLQGIPTTGWMLVSFGLTIAGFALLFLRKRLSPAVLGLLLIWLIGATLVSGAQILPGILTFELLRKLVPPVWAEFGNTTRAFPLVALALAALGPKALQLLFERSAEWFREKKWDVRVVTVFSSAGALLIAGIWSFPFLSGAITKPIWMNNEPMALAVYPVKPEDRAVYDFLRAAPTGARMTYVQPPWLGWSDRIDWGWTWEIGVPSPLPKFLSPPFNPRAWKIASDFSGLDGVDHKGKLLALAAVKYVVFPYELLFEDKRDYFPNQPGQDVERESFRNRFAPSKPNYDAALGSQKDLRPLPLSIPGTTIYENQSYLPRIYAAPWATLVAGSSDYLGPLANTPYFQKYPALFFSAQMSADSAARLVTQSARVLGSFSTSSTDSATASEESVSANPRWQLPNHTIYISIPPKDTSNAAGVFTLNSGNAVTVRVNVNPQPSVQNGLLMYANAETYRDEIPSAGQWNAARAELVFVSDYQWSANTPYARRTVAPNSLQVRARLDAPDAEPFVQFSKEVTPFDLRDYPTLSITSQVDDPKIQLLELRLAFDWDNDGKSDTIWTLPIVPEATLKPARVDLLAAVRDAFPQQKEFRVVGATIRLTRRPKVIVKETKPDLYGFQLNEISFQTKEGDSGVSFLTAAAITATNEPTAPARSALNVRGIAVALPASNRETMLNLSHAVENLRSGSGMNLTYKLDGPNTLLLDAAWIAGESSPSQTPLGTRILAPFSEGVLNFNLDGVPPSARIEFALSKLDPSTDLRATTFELNRLQFYQRKSEAAAKPAMPVLKIDDRAVDLAPLSPSEDRLGTWFASHRINLGAGSHTIAFGYPDPRISDRVTLIEIAPAAPPPPPNENVPSVSFRQINPTRYAVRVENAMAPFFLIGSDSFHSEWKAYILPDRDLSSAAWFEQSALLTWLFRGGQRAEITQHDMVNGFANAWYIDRAGSFDVEIEFIPQRMYEGGMIVSAVTLIACIGWVAVTAIKKRKTND